jgi:hypothetical protein
MSSPDLPEKKQAIPRQYCHFELWEDYRHNFYGGVTDDWERDETLELYASLLRDLPKFEAALQTIVREWPNCLRHNLTNCGLNRIAYLGQCALALVYRVPHKEGRGGYQLLTQDEKDAADAMAKKYLDLWLSENLH